MIAAIDSIGSREGRSIEQLQQTVSASRLNAFHQCRLKFYFQYVLALNRPKTAALYIGTTVHSVLQHWNKARWRNQPANLSNLIPVFDEAWVKGQAVDSIAWEAGEEDESKTTAWKLLEIYLKQTPIPPNEKPEAVEVSVEADLRSHGLTTLIGVIDLVRAGGKIVDFKTTSTTPNAERGVHFFETQLSSYAVLYRAETGKKETDMAIHHLVKLKTPKIVIIGTDSMTDAQQSRLFRIIESYLEGVSRQDWVPNPNVMTCSCCSYFNQCRKWG